MNSVLRALAARWPIIAVTTLACLLGGLWVTTTSAPRYQGNARVVLDYIRPDPVTGAVISSKMLDAYLMSQLRMLRDQQVAAPAAEILGWMDAPDVLAAYAARPASDTRDFAGWVSAILIPRIGARMVEGSNIMEISYNGESEELSRVAADALRTAYIQSNIRATQDASRASAETIQASIERVRKELAELEAQQNRIENETGVALGARGTDAASNSLRLMAKRPEAPVILRESAPTSTGAQLLQIEGAINRATQILGPNNPELLRLMRQREALRVQLAGEGATLQSKSAAIVAASRASAAQFEQLKSQALSAREPAVRLRLLQDQINNRLEEFRQLTETLVMLRGLQTNSLSSISPVGEAYAEPKPVYPNPPLILGGSGVLGLALGAILACLSELMGRRIRTPRHLEMASGVAILAEVPKFKRPARRGVHRARSGRGAVAATGIESIVA
jgi:succinoglycan biosynthesis transport protein ExoP